MTDPEATLDAAAEGEIAIEIAIETEELVELLPVGFKLPALIKFVPNRVLRKAADEAAVYALSLAVEGPDGLQRADTAATALRATLAAIDEHLEEPIAMSHAWHKRLTSIRAEWRASGVAALATVSSRMYTEQTRLNRVAADERRKAQADADREAKEVAQQEAQAAEAAHAPAVVVEEFKRQAASALAPPVSKSAFSVHPLRGSTTTVWWRARLRGTDGSAEPNPNVTELSITQRQSLFSLLRAVYEGTAPLAVITINWPYLNKRATSDKMTLDIPGIEVFSGGGMRAKSTRIVR